MEKKWILCFDCGDTLMDEGTQVFDEDGYVLSADPIPGAVEAVRYFHEHGWRLALSPILPRNGFRWWRIIFPETATPGA